MFNFSTPSGLIENRRAVLFDLDGTLIDSLPDITHAAQLATKELGGPEVTQEQIRVWVGKGVKTLVHRLMTGNHLDEPVSDEQVAHASAVFVRHYTEQGAKLTQLYPQVKDMLDELNAHNIPVALVTNKPYAITLDVLEQLAVMDQFQVIYGADSVPNCKPAPDMLLSATSDFGLAPEDCLMVGDSYNDVQSARNAGMPVVGLRGGYNHGEPIEDSKPDGVFDSIGAFYRAIQFVTCKAV